MDTRRNTNASGAGDTMRWLLILSFIALVNNSRGDELYWFPNGDRNPDWWDPDNWEADNFDPETAPKFFDDIGIYVDVTSPEFRSAVLMRPTDTTLIRDFFNPMVQPDGDYLLYRVGDIRAAASNSTFGSFTEPLMDMRLSGTYVENGKTYLLGLRSGRVQVGFLEVRDKRSWVRMRSGLWVANSFSVGDSDVGAVFSHDGGTLQTDSFFTTFGGIYRAGSKLTTGYMHVSGGVEGMGADIDVSGLMQIQYGGWANLVNSIATIGDLRVDPDGTFEQSGTSDIQVLSNAQFDGDENIIGGTITSPTTSVSNAEGKSLAILGTGVANLGNLDIGYKGRITVEQGGRLNASTLMVTQLPTDAPSDNVSELNALNAVAVSGDVITGNGTAPPPVNPVHGSTAKINVEGANGSLTARNILLSKSPAGKTTVTMANGGKMTAANDLVVGAMAGGNADVAVSGGNSLAKAHRIWIGRDAGSTGTVAVSQGGVLEADSIVLGPVTGTSSATLTLGGSNGSGFLDPGSLNVNAIIRAGGVSNTVINFRHQSPALSVSPRLQYLDVVQQSGSGKTVLNGRLWDVGTVVASKGTLEIAHTANANTMEYLGARDGAAIIINGASVSTPDVAIPRTILGLSGSGEMSVINGGSLTTSQILLGGAPPSGGTGTLNVEGNGSRVLLRDPAFVIGGLGNATVKLKSTGRISNITPSVRQVVTLGESATGYGFLTLSDFGTQFITGALTVGGAGRGTIYADDFGALLQSGASVIGGQATGEGDVRLGNNANWIVDANELVVGDAGKGTVELSTGSTLRVGPAGGGNLVLGKQATGQGTLKIGVDGLPGNILAANVYRGLASPDRARVWVNHRAADYTLTPTFNEVDFRLVSGNLGMTTLTSSGNFISRLSITSGGLRLARGGTVYMDGEVIVGDGEIVDMDPSNLPVLEVDGASSALEANVGLMIGKAGDGEVRLKNGGKLVVRNFGHQAEHSVILGNDTGNSVGTSSLVFGGSSTTAPGILDALGIHSYITDGRVIFDHSSTNYVMPAWMGGSLSVTHRSGTTLLGSNYQGYSGLTEVTGGTLLAVANVPSIVTLTNAAEYGGLGTTTRVNANSGTTISPGTFRPGEEIAAMRITSLNFFGGSRVRIDMGPNLTCDKILNHKVGTVTTTLFPVTSGVVTFDFRDHGIDQMGAYPVLTTTNPFTTGFMNRLAFTSNFPLQGYFRQTPVSSGGNSYHQLEFVVTSFSSPYATWVSSFGLDPWGNGAPGEDADRDGLLNLVEYVLGSSPISGVRQNMPTMEINGSSLLFSFLARPSIAGTFTSAIEYSTDLKNWTAADPSMIDTFFISGRGTVTTATIPRPLDGKPLFARLRVTR